MQLGPPGRLASSLFAATAALLGVPSGPSVAQETDTWKFDTSLLYYGESQRVQDLSANLLAQRGWRAGLLTFRITADVLTGASASGVAPALFPQTFTTPSGLGTYHIDAGTTPLDPTFHDTRIAASAGWLRGVGKRGELDLGLSASNEYDYLHTGANARYSLGLNQRNTTLGFGFAFAADSVSPVGGAPVPFAPMLPPGETGNKAGSDSKTVLDALIGVTQVLGKQTVAELNYSYSRSSGYLTDPYKLLSVIDPGTGDPESYLFESRPDQRTKQSVYAQVKHHFGRPIGDLSYRYMTDDWGVASHTVEMHWRQPLRAGWYVQPHLRWYTQTAADFSTPYLLGGAPLPDHASADYRLGALDDITLGLKVGKVRQDGREYSLRMEYYRQSGRAPPGAAFGSLTGLDLFPTVDAAIAQFQVRF